MPPLLTCTILRGRRRRRRVARTADRGPPAAAAGARSRLRVIDARLPRAPRSRVGELECRCSNSAAAASGGSESQHHDCKWRGEYARSCDVRRTLASLWRRRHAAAEAGRVAGGVRAMTRAEYRFHTTPVTISSRLLDLPPTCPYPALKAYTWSRAWCICRCRWIKNGSFIRT